MKIHEHLDIATAIVCDDVRREWNGKDILVGVYGSGIKFDAIPNVLICSLWLELACSKAGEYDLFLRVKDHAGQVVFQPATPAKLNVPEAGFSNVPVPGIGIQIGSTGKLQFQCSGDGVTWHTVRELNVIVGAIKPLGA